MIERLDCRGLQGSVVDAMLRPGSRCGSWVMKAGRARQSSRSKAASSSGPISSSLHRSMKSATSSAKVVVSSRPRKSTGQAAGSSELEQRPNPQHVLERGEQRRHLLPSEAVGGVGLEQPERERVEGGGVELGVGAGERILDAGPQSRRTAPGEAEQQDLVGSRHPVIDEVDGAAHQELGLAGPRPADNELRSVGIGNGRRPSRPDLSALHP